MDAANATGLEQAAAALRAARRVVAFTGAGVSAESGLPTFRQPQTGLWERYRPEDLATPEAFARDPELVWRWYAWRRSLVAAAHPNPAHKALVRLESRVPEFTLVTQNVDGLHRRAGSRNIVALHGDITRARCTAEGVTLDTWPEGVRLPPPCPRCGAQLRPDVVWFGEPLPAEALQTAVAAASACDVFLSVGTSGLVYPAAALPALASSAGATVIVVNPVPANDVTAVRLVGPAGEVLPALVARLET